MSTQPYAGRGVAVRRAAALLALTAVGTLAGGCGGDDESATERWASDVCTASADWREAVTAAGESLRAGPTTADDVRSAVDDLDEATEDFANELRDIGRPDTEAGEEAEEALDELADEVEESRDEIQSAVDDVEDVPAALEAASAVASILTAMRSDLRATLDELEQAEPSGELREAFQGSDECASLGEGE